MGEAKKENMSKTSWFAGLKAEFQKINWLDRDKLVRQTIAVVIVSVILGIIIAVIDMLLQYGVDFLVKL